MTIIHSLANSMEHRRLTDSHPARRNLRLGFEMMKMAHGRPRSRQNASAHWRDVNPAANLGAPARRCDGSIPAAPDSPDRAERRVQNASKRITSVDNVMTHA
jgi:hypothetical protein